MCARRKCAARSAPTKRRSVDPTRLSGTEGSSTESTKRLLRSAIHRAPGGQFPLSMAISPFDVISPVIAPPLFSCLCLSSAIPLSLSTVNGAISLRSSPPIYFRKRHITSLACYTQRHSFMAFSVSFALLVIHPSLLYKTPTSLFFIFFTPHAGHFISYRQPNRALFSSAFCSGHFLGSGFFCHVLTTCIHHVDP